MKFQNPSFEDTYNPGHTILAPFNNLADVLIPQVKRYLISTIINLVYELPHELPNDLRIKKLNFDNSCQKTRKIR